MAENCAFFDALSPLCHRLHIRCYLLSFYTNDLAAPERCVWCIAHFGLFKGPFGPLRGYFIVHRVKDPMFAQLWCIHHAMMMQQSAIHSRYDAIGACRGAIVMQ